MAFTSISVAWDIFAPGSFALVRLAAARIAISSDVVISTPGQEHATTPSLPASGSLVELLQSQMFSDVFGQDIVNFPMPWHSLLLPGLGVDIKIMP